LTIEVNVTPEGAWCALSGGFFTAAGRRYYRKAASAIIRRAAVCVVAAERMSDMPDSRASGRAVGSEFEKLREQALNLDLNARATLAQILLESLEDLAETESESMWLSEAERRQQEVREGRIKLVPGDEVKALLDRVLG
jgi:hypothetical protein